MSGDATGAATIEWAARTVMQVIQIEFAREVADKQFALAQEYSNRATQALESQLALAGHEIELRGYDNNKWFTEGGPCLSNFIAEVCGQPVHVANYNEEAARTVATVRAAGSIAAKKVFECADTYCIGMSQHAINEIAFKEAALATEAVNFAFRREEVDTERKNAVRLANKAQGIAMTKGSMNGSSAGLGGVAQAFASMANKAGEGMNSSLQSLGFNAQQLANGLINNPFRSSSSDPTAPAMQQRSTEDVGPQGNGFNGNQYGGFNSTTMAGVDAMSAPAVSAGPTWGSDPLQGVKGVSGSETTTTTDTDINGFW